MGADERGGTVNVCGGGGTTPHHPNGEGARVGGQPSWVTTVMTLMEDGAHRGGATAGPPGDLYLGESTKYLNLGESWWRQMGSFAIL